MRCFHEAAQVSGHALVRIEAEHPVELQMFACRLQQKSAVSALGNPAGRDVRLPRLVRHNQSDFRVFAKNLQRAVRTGVIIGDDRIDVFADVIQCVAKNKRFIANAGDSDQEVPVAQQARIARNDLLAVAEMPTVRARHDRHLAATVSTRERGNRSLPDGCCCDAGAA